MDKLAKTFYRDPDLVYKYKNTVEVPVLGMVDDVLCVTKCSSKSVISNATINAFMELNKLTLSADKGSSINYVITDRGGGVSSKDYGIT